MATWNVRTLNDSPREQLTVQPAESARAIELVRDLKRYRVDIAGISEVRWPGSGEQTVEGYRFLFRGKEREREAGVALVLSPAAQAAMQYYNAISERLILARFKSQHGYTTVIQVYAPTDAAPHADKTAFYDALHDTLSNVPRHDMAGRLQCQGR